MYIGIKNSVLIPGGVRGSLIIHGIIIKGESPRLVFKVSFKLFSEEYGL